jgi:hypothetical protein
MTMIYILYADAVICGLITLIIGVASFQKPRKIVADWLYELIDSHYPRPCDRLCNGIGVELGVWRGSHAARLLKRKTIAKLYLVDPYLPHGEVLDRVRMERCYRIAFRRVNRFEPRRWDFKLLTLTLAAMTFADSSLDFIYIDANHSEAAVYQDLTLWLPKIKSGGLIGGHDWNLESVKAAMKRFSLENGLQIHHARFDWWFVKLP